MWKRPVVAFLLLAGTAALTARWWLPSIGRDLVCSADVVPSDAILVENFDPDYLLFERAAELQRAGLASRVLVLAQSAGRHRELANPVSRDIAELMARHARVERAEIIPVEAIEPYTLHAAYQIRDFLLKERLRSVATVIPALRSKRSSMVHRAVLGPAGIASHCVPVFAQHTPTNWTRTWHGIQAVAEQSVKLQFYRLYLWRGRIV